MIDDDFDELFYKYIEDNEDKEDKENNLYIEDESIFDNYIDDYEISFDNYIDEYEISNYNELTKEDKEKEEIIYNKYYKKKQNYTKELYEESYNGYISSKSYNSVLKIDSIKNYVKKKNEIDLKDYHVKKINLFVKIALNLGLDFRTEENKNIDNKILIELSDNELITVLNLENKGYYFKNSIKKLINEKIKENFKNDGISFLTKLIENNVKINEKILLNIIYSNDLLKCINDNNNNLINKSIKEITENKEFKLNLKNMYLYLNNDDFCKSNILIEMPTIINEFNKNDIKYILKKINKIKNNNLNNDDLLNRLENIEEIIKFKNKSIENENELSYIPKELNEKYNIIINYNINKEQKEKLILQYQINYDTLINTLNDSLISYIKVDNDLKYEKIYNNKSAFEVMDETMDSIIEEQIKIKKLLNEDVVKKMQVNKNFISSRAL